MSEQQLQQPADGILLVTICTEAGDHTNVYTDGNGGTRGETFQGECTPFVAADETLISQRCEGTTLVRTVIDSTDPNKESVRETADSADCGFKAAEETPVVHPAEGEVIGEDCDGTTKLEHVADGKGGYTVRSTAESVDCGFQPPAPEPEAGSGSEEQGPETNPETEDPGNGEPEGPEAGEPAVEHPPAGTLVRTECDGYDKLFYTATGNGDATVSREEKHKDCGYVDRDVDALADKIAAALQSPNRNIQMVAKVLGAYRDAQGRSKPVDTQTLHDRQLQLWAAVRAALYEVNAFRDVMDLILVFFRDNRDGAFDLDMLLRTVDLTTSRLNGAQRQAYTGLMTLLTVAAGLNNPADVKKKVNLVQAINPEIFSGDSRMRILGYFD